MKESNCEEIGEKTMNNEMREGGKRKSIIIVILALLVTVIAVGIGFTIYNTPSNRLSRQLDLGEKYLEEQNYEQAIVEFDKAIVIDPMNERAYIGKAEAYVGMGDYEQAAATYVTAVQTIPEGIEIWSAAEQFYLDYAQIYIDNGDLVRAVEILEEGDALLDSDILKGKLDEVRTRLEEQKQEKNNEEESAKDESVSMVKIPGILATEGTTYLLNTVVTDSDGEMRMGSMNVTFSIIERMEGGEALIEKMGGEQADYWEDKLAPQLGYEWRYLHIDINTLGSTDGGIFYYNWTICSDNVNDWVDNVGDFDAMYNQYKAANNGMNYTDFEHSEAVFQTYGFADNGKEGTILEDFLYVRLPQDYDGNVYYTIYGTTLNGDSFIRNEEECVTFIF